MSDLSSQFGLPAPQSFQFKIRVVVAEGANELRLFLANHLQKIGFADVRTFRDGLSALAELKQKPADLLLIDSDLPMVSGLDFLKELKEDPTLVRGAFILLAKGVSKESLMLAVETGIDDFMVKPIIANDVLPKVRAAYNHFNNPKNPERLYEFAKVKIRANDLAAAEKIYQALSQSVATAARPLVGLARIAMKQNDDTKAMKFLSEAIKRNDKFVHAFALRGELFVKTGKIPEAIKDLQTAVDLSPLNAARYQSCCDLLIKENQIDACLNILNRGLDSGIESVYVTERAAHCCFLKKDFPLALKHYKEALRLNPDSTDIMAAMANCYREAKDFDSAIAAYNALLKKDPENHDALYNKGLTVFEKGETTEAIRLLERVMKSNPSHAGAKTKLPEFYLKERVEKEKKAG